MAIGTVAIKAVQVASRYAPQIQAAAERGLQMATSNRVASISQVGSYVGADPKRLSVAVQAMAVAGINPRDILPDDLVGTDRVLMSIRDSAMRVVGNMQSTFDRGSDNTLGGGVDDAAADVLRRERVEAVLRQYGGEKEYFLCHPNGGVPRSDFAWHKAVFKRGR